MRSKNIKEEMIACVKALNEMEKVCGFLVDSAKQTRQTFIGLIEDLEDLEEFEKIKNDPDDTFIPFDTFLEELDRPQGLDVLMGCPFDEDLNRNQEE